MRYYVGRVEDTRLQTGRIAHPCQLDTHFLPSEDKGQGRQITLLFWQVPYLQSGTFYEEHKTNKQEKTIPRAIWLCRFEKWREKTQNQTHKPPSAHSAQCSTDS